MSWVMRLSFLLLYDQFTKNFDFPVHPFSDIAFGLESQPPCRFRLGKTSTPSTDIDAEELKPSPVYFLGFLSPDILQLVLLNHLYYGNLHAEHNIYLCDMQSIVFHHPYFKVSN